MNIYLISWDKSKGYDIDIYSTAVVIANDEREARSIHPLGKSKAGIWQTSVWAHSPDDVTVQIIGEVGDDYYIKYRNEHDSDMDAHVICASFHAG
jgi:hypothetical protein